MTLEVIAFQAKKDEPSNPANKIAFVLGGHLCFVVKPEAAHEIIKQAVDSGDLRYRCGWNALDRDQKFSLVGHQLSRRDDLAQIAAKA